MPMIKVSEISFSVNILQDTFNDVLDKKVA